MQLYRLADPEQTIVIGGISGELPFAGGDATGWFEWTGVHLGGSKLVDGMRVPVQWQKPVLRTSPVEMTWNGLKFRALTALRIRGRVTGSVEIRGMPGKLPPMQIPGWPSVAVAAGQVEMLARWQGDLTRPGTWVGNLVGVASEMGARHGDRGEPLAFDSGRVAVDLRGGVLQAPDVRLMGERLSIMGNGIVLMDGRAVAVLRVVADPEYAETLTAVSIGSMISRGWTGSWLAPLDTPDRYYRDIHLQGQFPSYAVDVGRKREEMDLMRAVQWLAAFVKREQREEHREEPVVPGQGGRTEGANDGPPGPDQGDPRP